MVLELENYKCILGIKDDWNEKGFMDKRGPNYEYQNQTITKVGSQQLLIHSGSFTLGKILWKCIKSGFHSPFDCMKALTYSILEIALSID